MTGPSAAIPDADTLRRWYLDERKTTRAIGSMLGRDASDISKLLRRLRIPARTKSEAMLGSSSRLPSEDGVREMYVVRGMSTREIGAAFGISCTAVCKLLRRYGIAARTRSEAALMRHGSSSLDEATLRRLYLDEKLSPREIGAMYGISGDAVRVKLRKLGIVTRSPSEAWRPLRAPKPLMTLEMPCSSCGTAVTLTGQARQNALARGRCFCSDACRKADRITKRAARRLVLETNCHLCGAPVRLTGSVRKQVLRGCNPYCSEHRKVGHYATLSSSWTAEKREAHGVKIREVWNQEKRAAHAETSRGHRDSPEVRARKSENARRLSSRPPGGYGFTNERGATPEELAVFYGLPFHQPWVLRHRIRTDAKPFTRGKAVWYEADLFLPVGDIGDVRGCVVEIDGDQHSGVPKKRESDRRKDAWFRSRGIEILRVTNREVRADLPAVLRRIADAAAGAVPAEVAA